jgi:hypothetical protein
MAFREFVVVEPGGYIKVPPPPTIIKSDVEEWLFEVDMNSLRSLAHSADGYRFVSSESFTLSPLGPPSVQMQTTVHIKAQEDSKRPGFLGLYLHTDNSHNDDPTILDGLSMGFVRCDGTMYLKSFTGACSALGPDGLGWPDMIDKEHCVGDSVLVILRRIPRKGTKVTKLSMVMSA